MKTRVLIIEDEPGIALALYRSLSQSNYQVDTAKTGASGLQKAAAKEFDVILLDLNLPDMRGNTICRRLRDSGVSAPIIVLTGETSVNSKVDMFDAGANDYVTKPFSIDELQARIRACVRTPNEDPAERIIQVGMFTLNTTKRVAQREGISVTLRRKESAILEYLMLYANVPVSRTSIIQYAWGNEGEAWTNTVDVHIKHLRDKVDRPFAQQVIKTVHGVGYKLDISHAVAEIQ